MQSSRIPKPLGALFLAAALLSACSPAGSIDAGKIIEPQETAVLSGSEELSAAAPAATLESEGLITPQAASNNSDDILRFTFPDAAPEPESLWRPPLNDVPWALNPHDHFLFVRPIAADEVNWPLADYRYGGIFPGSDPPIVHTGIDIPNPRGTPVQAAGPGKVVWAGYGLFNRQDQDADPYGLAVAIKHDFGYQGRSLYTIYAHMDRVDVIFGQRVETGTQLGSVGTTGFTTGPHLHFEVRIESNSFYATRNPELWLAPPQGWGVLVGNVMNSNMSLLTKHEVTVVSKSTGQKWSVLTYGETAVIRDDYYKENAVLSDLPAGEYEVIIDYLDDRYSTLLTISPGAITYFNFQGKFGFNTNPPTEPSSEDWMVLYPPEN